MDNKTEKNIYDILFKPTQGLKPKTADLIIAKYTEIIKLAAKSKDELADILKGRGDITEAEIEKIKEDLLEKAKKIIDQFFKAAEDGLVDEKENEALIKELEKNGAELELLSSLLKFLAQSGKRFKIDDIRDFSLKINKRGEDLSSREIKEILEIANENWKNQNNKLAPIVLKELEEDIKTEKKTIFYILECKEDIVCFVKFIPLENGALYIGSLNVEPELHGLGIGQEIMIKAIAEKKEKNILEATVSPRIPAGCCYVEKIGFVIDGLIPDYRGSGESLFTITLNNEKNKKYINRNDGKDEDQQTTHGDIVHRYKDNHFILGQDEIILRFDMDSDFKDFLKTMAVLLPNKDDGRKNRLEPGGSPRYTITRYFQDKSQKEKDIRFFILEKI